MWKDLWDQSLRFSKERVRVGETVLRLCCLMFYCNKDVASCISSGPGRETETGKNEQKTLLLPMDLRSRFVLLQRLDGAPNSDPWHARRFRWCTKICRNAEPQSRSDSPGVTDPPDSPSFILMFWGGPQRECVLLDHGERERERASLPRSGLFFSPYHF